MSSDPPAGGKRILADHEDRLLRRQPLREATEGVDGVGRPRALDLQQIESEAGVVRDRAPDPLAAELGRGDDLAGVFLVGWLGAGNEDHALEAEDLGYLLGGPQVAEVNGIEGPPENADSASRVHSRIWPSP